MKKFTFMLLFFVLSIYTGFSQVQLGSGNNLTQNLPFNTSKNYSYSQSIYLNSEVNATGTITSIQWYYQGTSPLNNNQSLVIYMGTTAKSNFTTTTDWIASTALTQVYSGGIITEATPGWKTITLTTPFVYDGLNNLVVAVDENMASADGISFKFKNFNTSETRSIGYASNTVNPDPLNPPTSGASSLSSSNYVPNIIFGGINQTCTTPLNITFPSIDATSFIANWESQGTAPAEGYELYLSTNATTPTSGTAPSFTVPAGQTTFTVTGLTPSQTYYFWIKSKCSAAVSSAFSELKTINTTATPVTTFFESFENSSTPNLPLGWSKILRGPSLASNADIKSSTININITPQSAVLTSGISTFLDDIILVSRNVSNIADANNRLKFYARGTGTLQVGTASSNDENAVFTNVLEIPITNTTTLYKVDYDYDISTDHFLAIRLVTTGSSINTYIDDIRWEAIPNCPDVSDISVPIVNANDATINWVSNTSGENTWNIAIAPSSTLAPDALTFSTSTTNGIFNVTDLATDTEYKVWVRSVCGTDNGAWIGPIIFRTDCNAVATISENFDSTVSPNLPSCWSKILRGETISASANVKTIASNANSGTTSLQLSNSTSTGEYDVIAVSPRLSTLSLGTYRVKFFAKGAGVLQIGTVSTATNDATFTSLGSSITTTTVYTEYTVEFTAYTGTDTHFGIRMASPSTNSIIYIDDLFWEVTPLCPDVTEIVVNVIGSTTTTINWAENLGVSTWNIAIGETTDTDPTTLPFFTSTTQGTYDASGLESNSSYNVWVRSVCGINNGSWIGPVQFTTNCPAVAIFNENFDTVTAPALPDCWKKIKRGATVGSSADVATATSSAASSPNAVSLKNTNSTGVYDLILVSPPVNATTLNSSRIKFSARSLTETGGVLQVGTLNSNTDTAIFTSIQEFALGNSTQELVVNLDGVTNGNTFVGFRLNSASTYKTVYVDNVVLEPIPFCPDVTNIAVSDIATTSATLTWGSTGIESSWNIAIGATTVTDPNTLTPYTSTFDSYILEDLTPSSTYKVWVRSICTSGNGAWVGPMSFSTSCNPATTLNENFNTGSPLPICWNKIIRNGAATSSSVATGSGGTSGTRCATIYAANSSAGVDVIMVTPNLSNLNAGNQVLTFDVYGSNSIEIGTLTSDVSDAVFTPIQTYPLTESFQTITLNFATYTGTDHYIGFRIVTGSTTTSSQYLAVDNVVWGPNLGSDDFETNKITVYPNPVRDIMNITSASELTSVSVYNLVGQLVLNSTQNLSQIDMSSLSNGTYLVKLNGIKTTKTLKVIKN